MGRWQVSSVSFFFCAPRYRSQLAVSFRGQEQGLAPSYRFAGSSPTRLMVEAMGADARHLWKYVQVGNAQIVVCLRVTPSAG